MTQLQCKRNSVLTRHKATEKTIVVCSICLSTATMCADLNRNDANCQRIVHADGWLDIYIEICRDKMATWCSTNRAPCMEFNLDSWSQPGQA